MEGLLCKSWIMALTVIQKSEYVPRIVVKSEDERLVYAEVYSPLHIDTDGEAMTKEEIRKMAHRFLMNGRTSKIDVQHNQQESGCLVCESSIAKANDPDGFIEGAWVIGVYVLPDELWTAVKKGELNGFSFFGAVKKVTVRAQVLVARKMIGETEESLDSLLPPHSHSVVLNFSENGRVLPGETDAFMGHKHQVLKATATEMNFEHAHRLVIIEN